MPNKRQAIIDTAMRLFYAHGYHVIGVDRIIAEAGVAKMTMYKYFPSKTSLISTVLRERNAQFLESLSSFAGSFSGALEKLKAIFTWHDRWLNDGAFNGCMFISAAAEYPDPSDEIHVVAKLHKQAVQDYIAGTLQESVSKEVAKDLAAQLLQLLEGAIVTGLVFSDKKAATTAWRTAAALLAANGIAVGYFTLPQSKPDQEIFPPQTIYNPLKK
ncbi:MAG: TetR/AcrR family transcriptional regulator [Ferrovum sp.]|nr:TetR/AcrR family transcriptional regulator [Ferrovum sp.]